MFKVRVTLIALLLVLASCGEDSTSLAAQAEKASQPEESWPLIWLVEEGSCQNTETRVLVENATNLITWADRDNYFFLSLFLPFSLFFFPR